MNKVSLLGRLTKDPELSQTNNGIPVLRFTLAVDRRFKNSQGEREVDFISCRAWRQTAEFIARFFQKGSRIAVAGSIRTGSYEKNGQTIYTTDVEVDEAYFCESRQGSEENRGYTTQTSRQAGPSWNQNSQYGQRQSYGQSPSQGGQHGQSAEADRFIPAPSDDTELPFEL